MVESKIYIKLYAYKVNDSIIQALKLDIKAETYMATQINPRTAVASVAFVLYYAVISSAVFKTLLGRFACGDLATLTTVV